MDRQLFIDKILESENLTDALEDEDADTLLNWGIKQVDALIEGVTDEDAAGERINDLMHMMRGLSAAAGNPSRISHDAIVDLINRFSKIAGDVSNIDEGERKALVERLSKMESGEVIQHLTNWLESKKS